MTHDEQEARRLITEALGASDTIEAVIDRTHTARATLQQAAEQAQHGDLIGCSQTLGGYADTAAPTETEALYDLCFAGSRLTAEAAPQGQQLAYTCEDTDDNDDVLWDAAIQLVNMAIEQAWNLMNELLEITHREGGVDALRDVVIKLMGIYRRIAL